MPDQGRFTDAARYLQQLCFSITKYRIDRLAIRVLFSADDLRQGERCGKLGLIVSELLTKWRDMHNSTLDIWNCEWSRRLQ